MYLVYRSKNLSNVALSALPSNAISLNSMFLRISLPATTISLSTPYDASNNFMNLTIDSTTTGLLLLEDGIGTANAGYLGNTSTEGSFKFEILSTFNNQTPKFIQT